MRDIDSHITAALQYDKDSHITVWYRRPLYGMI